MKALLTVGLDASNLRAGGGLTHLTKFLHEADPLAHGIGRIVLWGGTQTLVKLPDRPWLVKRHVAALDQSLPRRMAWQRFELRAALREERCDALFAPGGLLPPGLSMPTVTMSQNMLPFEPAEAARFGRFSAMWWKFKLLRHEQTRSMRQASGLIFLTQYARRTVLRAIGDTHAPSEIIPHGIEDRFFRPPRPAVAVAALSDRRPFKLLYVSIVDAYKHQWHVAKAIEIVRARGIPVEIDFIGTARPAYLRKLNDVLDDVDPAREFARYRGLIPFEDLHSAYQDADAFVFASTCENLPNILLEAMAAGLPIASSHNGPMPETLPDSAWFFDAVDPGSIADAIGSMIGDAPRRQRAAAAAHAAARAYSWKACAAQTLAFIKATIDAADPPLPQLTVVVPVDGRVR